MRKSIVLSLLFAAFGLSASQPVISHVVARQMWPWDAKYRVDYALVCDPGACYDVTLTVSNGTESYPIPPAAVTADAYAVSTGEHALLWNPAAADAPSAAWLAANRDNLSFSLSLTPAETAEYLVLDLSGGESAASYPSVRLTEKEATEWGLRRADGTWIDLCKTERMVFRRVKAGSFLAGAPTDEPGYNSGREVQVELTLTNDFWIGVFELTKGQYRRIKGTPYTSAKSAETAALPDASFREIIGVEGTNWPRRACIDADSLCGRLNARVTLPDCVPTGWRFFLPTDAQWEYACRAGTSSAYNDGSSVNAKEGFKETSNKNEYTVWLDENLDRLAWYRGNLVDWYMRPVGLKIPNAWGIFDMHGNAAEFCIDANVSNKCGGGGTVEPRGSDRVGSDAGAYSYRVVRGGSWRSSDINSGGMLDSVQSFRSAARGRTASNFGPDSRETSYFGYRIVLSYARGSKE